MNFIDNLKLNQSLLEKYYNENKFSIVRRPLPDHYWGEDDDGNPIITSYTEPFSPEWYFDPSPFWNWDKYEYRAYIYVDKIEEDTVLNSMFVYADSSNNLYWNKVSGKYEPTTVNRRVVNPSIKKLENKRIYTFIDYLKAKTSTLQSWLKSEKYTVFYRPLPEYSISKGHYLEPENTKWNFIANPTWEWDKYEYRAYSYKEDTTDEGGKTTKGLNLNSSISSMFVYNYNGNLYYNSVEGLFEKELIVDKTYAQPIRCTLSISGLKSYIENLKDHENILKGYSDEGLFSIIHRPLPSRDVKKGHYFEPEVQNTWIMISKPTWDWNNYEYRAFKPVKVIPDEGTLDPLFVYGYGYNVYYNSVEGGYDSAQIRTVGYINGTGLNGTIYNKISMQGDLQVFKDVNVQSQNASLQFIGKTYRNFKNTVNGKTSDNYGPKVEFRNSDKSQFSSIAYTDKSTEFVIGNTTRTITSPSGVLATDVLKESSTTKPTIRIFHSDNSTITYLDKANFKNVVALTENTGTINVPTATLIRANITNLWLWNTADVLFPIGSYYWSSNDVDPGKLFQGKWERIKNAFFWAVGDSEVADGNKTTYTSGEYVHTLTTNEIPTHNHHLTDTSHNHGVIDPMHTHPVTDPGHVHTITDKKHKHDIIDPSHSHHIDNGTHKHKIFGDDQIEYYMIAASGVVGYDACSTLWGGRGGVYVYTQTEKTGITVPSVTSKFYMSSAKSNGEIQLQANMAQRTNKSSTNIEILGANTNISIDNTGGSKPHNNMPPYIKCYCWHRIE